MTLIQHDSDHDPSSTSTTANDTSTVPRLPAEILANIIELAIFTSTPCPLIPPPSSSSSTEPNASPFTTPLRGSYTSSWAWVGHLLHVSKFFYSIAQPLLLRTLTLDTAAAAKSFLRTISYEEQKAIDVLGRVERAWFGNISTLERRGFELDPVGLKLRKAGWWEDCSGGFIVGHAYVSREKPKRKRKDKRVEFNGKKERRYRNVSVYWAEEQFVEEVSDDDLSSDGEDSDISETDGEQGPELQTGIGLAQSLPLQSNLTSRDQGNGAGPSQRRRSHNESGSSRDPRIDRPHEPAWQTLYVRQRRSSPIRTRGQLSSAAMADNAPAGPSISQIGPSEGNLDPWDMQDAQERLAALANSSDPITDPDLDPADVSHGALPVSALDSAQHTIQFSRRKREIYAYHLTLATLEPFINPLLASLRSLRLITITFYPGHLLDDDKLEHMLRRILSPSECPRLETLLIRIVFDAASAGSRMRRFERTKTIAGAADRIGDERVRVMLVNDSVGEGKLVALPKGGAGEAEDGAGRGLGAVTRKAITLTKEGWWARILQHNHSSYACANEDGKEIGDTESEKVVRQGRKLSDWQMFFPPQQAGNATHLINLIHHCDPWPDCPDPVT